ncbi:MAG: hypothetical protein OEZ38_15050 [Gammaproteobacteria bacterium]|nr:hypothetical protein [Gammaproteobacteria bacterium]
MIKHLLKSILAFFNADDNTSYAHRDRRIEIVAEEKGIDINALRQEVTGILEKQGRVAAISMIQKRFHVPLSFAWGFVDKLDKKDQ